MGGNSGTKELIVKAHPRTATAVMMMIIEKLTRGLVETEVMVKPLL